MQLFQVKDDKGNLIMNAPLEVVRWVFGLPALSIGPILHTTKDLGKSYKAEAAKHSRWPIIVIERLPMEIPFEDLPGTAPAVKTNATVVELRQEAAARAWDEQLPGLLRPQAGGPTRQTDLGELLCDE